VNGGESMPYGVAGCGINFHEIVLVDGNLTPIVLGANHT
jgi:hypothetical protein